jgi:hypothetical protein
MSFETDADRQARIHRSRIKTQALAIIRRGVKAGIPKRYLRIDEPQFEGLLNKQYHVGKDGVNTISNFIYHESNKLLQIPLIVIDGGCIESRKKAGFAILFRLIACDKFGLYKDCSDMVHKMQTFVSEYGLSRNDFTNSLKDQDVIFISEFHESMFSKHLDGGNYFDEFLGHRVDNLKPTIISFSDPIVDLNMIKSRACGRYLAEISAREHVDNKNKALNPSDYMLRVRVSL